MGLCHGFLARLNHQIRVENFILYFLFKWMCTNFDNFISFWNSILFLRPHSSKAHGWMSFPLPLSSEPGTYGTDLYIGGEFNTSPYYCKKKTQNKITSNSLGFHCFIFYIQFNITICPRQENKKWTRSLNVTLLINFARKHIHDRTAIWVGFTSLTWVQRYPALAFLNLSPQ